VPRKSSLPLVLGFSTKPITKPTTNPPTDELATDSKVPATAFVFGASIVLPSGTQLAHATVSGAPLLLSITCQEGQ